MWYDEKKVKPKLNKHGESDWVLCLTSKFGRNELTVYELLFWDGKIWQNMDTDDFE